MIRIPYFSRGLRQLIFLHAILGRSVTTHLLPICRSPIGGWVGWGAKRSSVTAAWYAKITGGVVVRIEDGFLRSYSTGNSSPPLSLVVDDIGIYYDSRNPSALERLLASPDDLLLGLDSDVARAKSLIIEYRLSKYNHAPFLKQGLLREDDTQRVLVIDQTAGDMSVSLGSANADTFAAMLAAAYVENPQATIYVKTHPEVTSGHKGGYLTHVQSDERTVVLREAVNPLSLIEQMDRVYVVTSTMGFEAVLAGKFVSVFGLPWYAGWGVTDDRQHCKRRMRNRTVDELFAAAYFHYTRYLNPITHERGTIFDVIDWLIKQREMSKDKTGRVIAVGFRRWKAVNIKPLLSLDQKQAFFVPNASKALALMPNADDCLVYWGREAPAGLRELAEQSNARLLSMEDGFVRSVGLGSDLIRPLSIVLDGVGIYFDPTRPSGLEVLLNEAGFSDVELERARQVRAVIVEHGVTKYNIEPREKAVWISNNKEVVLVPGQVEDDASIRYGCVDIKTNIDLLKAARLAHPQAFIVYKPHPDVMSGNRIGQLALNHARKFADHVETHLSVVSCIEACDVVHTMTSLTGFDALLRGKRVVVYGQPFYAGWGLTEDKVKDGVGLSRRHRTLTIDELVAGTLLKYPLYWDWDLKGYTTCEAVLRQIIKARTLLEARGDLAKLRLGYFRRQWRKIGILLNAWVKS